jgi:hypothetical protein
MDLNLLDSLKEKLVTARDFGRVFDFFLRNFGEKPEFLTLGESVRAPDLEELLRQIGRQMFGGDVPLGDLRMLRLPEQGFIHGGCSLNGRLATVIYFEDIQTGLLAVAASVSPPETKLARFSLRGRTGIPSPSEN